MIPLMMLIGCSASAGGASPAATASPKLPVYLQTWPVRTGDHAGRTLQLSQTTVTPGEVITRMIVGADPKTDVTDMDLMLEQFTNGNWRLVSYLILGLPLANQPPTDQPPVPNLSIPAVGYHPTTLPVLIPHVRSGTYRVRQDMSIKILSTPITLYAPLQVVLPATPNP